MHFGKSLDYAVNDDNVTGPDLREFETHPNDILGYIYIVYIYSIYI
jgi:hypothetical protein